MNFLAYVYYLMKNNKKYYWYDMDKKCVYIPGENICLELTIEDIRRIIFDRKFKYWNTKQIFDKEKLSSNVSFWTLNYWVKEYEKGLMDYMISWLSSVDSELNDILIFLKK